MWKDIKNHFMIHDARDGIIRDAIVYPLVRWVNYVYLAIHIVFSEPFGPIVTVVTMSGAILGCHFFVVGDVARAQESQHRMTRSKK